METRRPHDGRVVIIPSSENEKAFWIETEPRFHLIRYGAWDRAFNTAASKENAPTGELFGVSGGGGILVLWYIIAYMIRETHYLLKSVGGNRFILANQYICAQHMGICTLTCSSNNSPTHPFQYGVCEQWLRQSTCSNLIRIHHHMTVGAITYPYHYRRQIILMIKALDGFRGTQTKPSKRSLHL